MTSGLALACIGTAKNKWGKVGWKNLTSNHKRAEIALAAIELIAKSGYDAVALSKELIELDVENV